MACAPLSGGDTRISQSTATLSLAVAHHREFQRPIAFVVDRILEVTLIDGGLGGMSLTETAVTDRSCCR